MNRSMTTTVHLGGGCVHFSAIAFLNLIRKWIHAARKWFAF